MGKMKKIIAFALFFCIVFSLLPPMQFAGAAEVVERYELDTDGIDIGATYLIVNTGTAGDANALKFRYGNSTSTRRFTNQIVQVQTDENGVRYIAKGFTDEANCVFQFSGTESGKITHDNYLVDLANGRYVTSTSSVQTLSFTEVGSGAYRIHYSTSSFISSTTYYLRFSSSSWARSTTNSTVYLYKLVQHEIGYNIHFDGNGYTSGQLPADAEMLNRGTLYTVPAAPAALRKDEGQDTWLFRCWNTEPDGSGTEYAPGDVITVTEDLTLYAEWYQQIKYAVTMVTELNSIRTDVTVISGQNKTFAIQKSGGDGTFIPMERTAEGTYVAKVPDNGDYIVYSRVDNGEYEPVHGHMVTIYNQDGTTVCQHYTVSYNTQGGAWGEGQNPGIAMCHALETVTLTENVPTLAGNRFLGWQDQDGNIYAPGAQITNVQKEIVLSALWEKTIDITIQIVVDHTSDGGYTSTEDRHEVLLQILREENGVNLPLEQILLNSAESFDPQTNKTTYTVVLKDQPQGIYHAACAKTYYETNITYAGAANENQTITVNLKYTPENFDLSFEVNVNADTQGEKGLMPQAVNVKVSYWNGSKWNIITQQAGDNAPITVAIDENGKGTGFFPVWSYRTGDKQAYEYRVEVTSIVMPDGSIVPLSGNGEVYTSAQTGLYRATVSIENGGRVPTQAALPGAYVNEGVQIGTPTVTVEISPYTVTFDAGAGTVNGKKQLVLENQYLYPDAAAYKAIPADASTVFLGWFDQYGNPAEALTGYLQENIVYTARYGDNITLSGKVEVATTYEQDGETVSIPKTDVPAEVVVLVRKQIGDYFITLESQKISITYAKDAVYGVGEYKFENLPNDGTTYQVSVLCVNYDCAYDNNLDGTFSQTEDMVIVDALKATAQANALLTSNPELYRLGLQVDASQIAEGFRPTDVLAQIMYRDLGDVHLFNLISQHTKYPYGVPITLDKMGLGVGADDVWVRHVDGTYYEYQIELSKLYGSVTGAYVPGGTDFTADSPFTVEHGAPGNYLNQAADGSGALKATLVPKKYAVILDLNLGDDPDTSIRGMDKYLVDDGTGNARYAYVHTWSHAGSFEAYPYRDGYVFEGWKENAETAEDKDLVVENGVVYVGATLAKNVTLTAQWRKLSGTDYTIRHLELNTNKVLHGAQAVSGTVEGGRVVAADVVLSIPGYEYAGAAVDGIFVHKSNNPAMIVSADPLENLMVIYYLPDSSSGYTEQVESNVSANKHAVLENNGTYTITLDTFTKDNPVTTQIRYDTPLDVVLVLDQSGSMYTNQALDNLKAAVSGFITQLADHGRNNEVDHRVAIVGYASGENDGYTNYKYPSAGSEDGYYWYNTGVFGVHGDFHPYSVTGFNYTAYDGLVSPDGLYYTKANDEFLLLTYHEEYRHLITEEEARQELLQNTPIYGYADGQFVELTRNSSGLWLYGDKKLYTSEEFFTYHTDVWTHREGLERREIHAYGTGGAYTEVGEHQGVYTRAETKDANPQKSIYKEALIPISVGANGSGAVTPGLVAAPQKLGGNGSTRVSYGMEMANSIFEANPLEEGSDRLRIVIVFADGKPGDGSNFDEAEANQALEYAGIAVNHYGADVYTIGLYGTDVVAAESDQVFFMNGLSSNYPNATKMDDIWVTTTYQVAESGIRLDLGGPYYVNAGGAYYLLTRTSLYENRTYYNCWGYTDASGNRVIISKTPTANGHPTITDGKVGDYTIYRQYGEGYKTAQNTGYYVEANSSVNLKDYFAKIMQDITTNVTTKIILESDTIVRDIMNQGLVMTNNTVITVYTQEGNYNTATSEIDWSAELEEMVKLELKSGQKSATGVGNNVKILTYNLDAANATDPAKANYQPHTVDITGYNFSEWYISQEHTKGYKMIITITGIEARDDVQWGRSTATNHQRSGLWLPADENGNRQLLLAFNQPNTIFVERAYVLDYGKEFVLSGWYFDDDAQNGLDATPVHLDFDITNGMNGFDVQNPNLMNSKAGAYGNLKYGNARLENGNVIYRPTTMNWGGYDQFYVFGNTWRKTVLAQEANENGNLWNKVTVIPANNVYYEDSFITTADTTQNSIEGFTFTGVWETVGEESNNTEIPEHLESAPYGDVHGWTDSLGDDVTFTDGSAHFTNTPGASAQFTFTGTGVEVYSRTNARTGFVVAVLNSKTIGANGQEVTSFYRSFSWDTEAVSGDYYSVPTVSFKDLPYGTYSLVLYATTAVSGDGSLRNEYYIDGVRVINPLGNATNYQSSIVKDAYGLETNAVFTEVRDILIDKNNSFNADQPSVGGAVFIDQIKPGQGSGNDQAGTGVATYEIGTFEDIGPKNEVYLSAGQAIVLKVEEGNNYYVGLKSLTGHTLNVNISGVNKMESPRTITINHTADMYYRVHPVDGYIVIQNANTDDARLSITNLRTTNANEPAVNGGVVAVAPQAAVLLMRRFSEQILAQENNPDITPEPEEPNDETTKSPAEIHTEETIAFANAMFTSVRQWMDID